MTGAKVGGRMVPFDHTLHTGDIVEILTSGSDNYGPNRNWSEIAKTNEAKAKIRAWFKRERREENIECGKAAFEKRYAETILRSMMKYSCRRHTVSVYPRLTIYMRL